MTSTLQERVKAFDDNLAQEKHEKEIIESLKSKVISPESKEVIQIASELADMIISHEREKENAKKWQHLWRCNNVKNISNRRYPYSYRHLKTE